MQGSRFKVLEWQGSPFQMIDYSEISNEDDHTLQLNLLKNMGLELYQCQHYLRLLSINFKNLFCKERC